MSDIPSVPQTQVADPNLRPIIDAVRQVLQVRAYSRDDLSRWVTWQDLLDQGIVRQVINGDVITPAPGPDDGNGFTPVPPSTEDPADTTPPGAPTSLAAVGGQFAIYLTWSMPSSVGISYYELWRNTIDNLGTAVLVGTATSQSYADFVTTTGTYYYWVRAVSIANITGPFNGTAGTSGAVSFDPEIILGALTDVVFQDDLTAALATRTKTFWQTTAPTASSVGDLWFDSDDNNLMYRWNGTSWVATPDGRISTLQTQVTALTSTSGGSTANITALQNTVNGLSAQYTVKIDNNGFLSGFGLASDPVNGTPESSFNVLSNRFALLQPSGPKTVTGLTRVGTTATATIGTGHGIVAGQPFVINWADDKNWNGTWTATGVTTTAVVFTVPSTLASSPGIVSGRAAITLTPVIVPFVVDSGLTVIDGALIKNASIKNASIGSLVADKITAGQITAAIGLRAAKIHGAEFYLGGTVTAVFDVNGVFTNYTVNNPTVSLSNGSATFVVDSFKILNRANAPTTVYVPFFLGSDGIVYMDAARIRDGDITNAKIGNVIQSTVYTAGSTGWKIDKAGNVEINNLTARGNITANNLNAATGTFRGSLSAATGTFAGSLSAASGTFTGALSGATGTFGGSLSAATGTFSGSLTAAAINAVDTINLAGQAVTFAVDAFTAGTFSPPNTQFHTVQQITIPNPSGAPIAVFFSFDLPGTSNNPRNVVSWQIISTQAGIGTVTLRSGTAVIINGYTGSLPPYTPGGVTISAACRATNVNTNSLTIQLQVFTYDCSNRYLFALETKR